MQKVLLGGIGKLMEKKEKSSLFLQTENMGVMYVANCFVSCSRPMMRELCKLKYVLDEMGLKICTEWIPSIENKF